MLGLGAALVGLRTPGGREGRPGNLDSSGVPFFLERPRVAPSGNCWVERAAVFSYSALLTVRRNIVFDFR